MENLRVRDRFKLTQAMVVDPLYLQHSHSGKAIDYRVTIVYCYKLKIILTITVGYDVAFC
jgi:hypothetical protein